MNWWEGFWSWAETSQLGSNVVGGLIVAFIAAVAALIVSIVKTSWREKIWGSVAGYFRWIGTIRLTTTKRIAGAVKELEQIYFDQGVAWINGEATQTIAKLQSQLRVATGGSYPDDPDSFFEEPTDKQIRDAAWESLTPPTVATSAISLPSPAPRWMVYSDPDDPAKGLYLRNAVKGSTALQVRLEEHNEKFEFHDGAYWDDVTGDKVVNFSGEVVETDSWRTLAVEFEVRWLNDEGETRNEFVKYKTGH